MAATSTGDTRTHVMGDMLMITGTFIEGGTEFSFDGLLSTVFAAGGHLTSTAPSGLLINNGSTEAIGQTVLTVDTGSVAGDARSCVYVGQTLYNGLSGARLGKITVVTATAVTIDTALTEALPDDAPLHVRGASKMSLLANAAITAQNNSLDVSIDEANSLVIFDAGRNIDTNDNSLTGVSPDSGRFWILGQR